MIIISYLSIFGLITQSPLAHAQSGDHGDGWKTAYIFVDTHPFPVMYKLSSGALMNFTDVKGNKFVMAGNVQRCGFCEKPSPVVDLWITIYNATSSGTLVIKIPGFILESKLNDNLTDGPFRMAYLHTGTLMQAQPANQTSTDTMTFQEVNRTADSRTLIVNFPVEPPSYAVRFVMSGITEAPEFGGVSITVLSLSLLSVIFIMIRFRKFS
jgi:hypothetical protein